LQTRVKKDGVAGIQKLYAGMNVETHGMHHVSHAKDTAWLTSVTSGIHLVDSSLGRTSGPFLFRPPYGQRTQDAAQVLQGQKGTIMLWNIDSQDWRKDINADQAAGRAVLLMALWRRGIVLFHDVHPKAVVALPQVFEALKTTNIHWMQNAGDTAQPSTSSPRP